MYTAVVLYPQECQKLKSLLNEVAGWSPEGFVWKTAAGEPLPHHMTLNMNGLRDGPNPRLVIGDEVSLTVDGFCWDHNLGVCAARVTNAVKGVERVNSVNAQPHITMCILPGCKPFNSNKLNWSRAHELTTPLVVSGVVEDR